MQSKTLYFNKTLFFNTISRFWPLWVAYAIAWTIILPLSLTNQLRYMGTDLIYANQRTALSIGCTAGCVMAFIFAALAAMAVFNYLYSAKSAGMMAALPIKREAVFLTQFLAGLTPLLIINLFIFLLALGVEALYGAVSIVHLLSWLAMVSMMNVLFFGFASFCAMLTGHLLALPAVYFLLNFTVVVVEYLVENLLSEFVYGMSSFGNPILGFLSPAYNIVSNTAVESSYIAMADASIVVNGYFYNGWPTLVIYCAVGLVFSIFAVMLYHRRKMETSSDVVAIRPLKPIFKYCLAGGCALVLGTLLFSIVYSFSAAHRNSVFWLTIFMLLGGFIGYFAAEMLVKKSLRVWRRRWKGYAIFSLALIALICICEFDLFGYEKKVPDAEDITAVRLTAQGESSTLDDAENIAAILGLHNSIVSNKDQNERMMYEAGTQSYTYYDYNWSDYDYLSVSFIMTYTLKNGGIMERQYTLWYTPDMAEDPTSDVRMLNEVFNCQEAIEDRKELNILVAESTIIDAYINWFTQPESVEGDSDYYAKESNYTAYNLTDAEVMELYYECILPDISDGSLGRIWLIQNSDYYETVYNCTININLGEKWPSGKYTHENFYTYLTIDSFRSNNWLAQHDITPMLMGETINIEQLQ